MKKDTCNSRCWHAESSPSKCKCSCGGTNHGQGYIGERMHDVQQTYPPCTPVRIRTGDTNRVVTVTSKGETRFISGEIHLRVQEDFFLIPLGWVVQEENNDTETSNTNKKSKELPDFCDDALPF